jgi:hypothetical protein
MRAIRPHRRALRIDNFAKVNRRSESFFITQIDGAMALKSWKLQIKPIEVFLHRSCKQKSGTPQRAAQFFPAPQHYERQARRYFFVK